MDACPNGEVGDWRLSDLDFLATFALPQRRPDKLATQNPFAQDARIHFDEPSHTYTFDGQRVGRSVTGLLHQFSSEFDAAAALEAMKRSPEWEIKKATLEEQGLGTSDHDFLERWSLNGRVQRSRGTLHHFHCECMVNGVEVEEPHSPGIPAGLRYLRSTPRHGSTAVAACTQLFSSVLARQIWSCLLPMGVS